MLASLGEMNMNPDRSPPMSITVLYLVTVVIFLAADIVGLRFIVKPVFDRDIGHLLLDSPRYGPALVFYLFFVAALFWFVSVPALRDGASLGSVWFGAAILGAVGYGTYEFTNLATLKGWTWQMVWTDLIWGTMLSATSATLGLAITRAIFSSPTSGAGS